MNKDSTSNPRHSLFPELILLMTMIVCLCSCHETKPAKKVDPYFAEVLPSYAMKAQMYLAATDLNKDYCILVDYSIPSGKPRVFLWSFLENKIIFKAHTMHGPGGGSTKEHAVLGNVSGSNCSAPGHFKITRESGAKVRPSFRMKGLDKANSNAYERGIMLHGAWLVDQALENHVKYLPIDKIWCAGCVTTSGDEIYYLESFIKGQSKSMLLWSFKSSD